MYGDVASAAQLSLWLTASLLVGAFAARLAAPGSAYGTFNSVLAARRSNSDHHLDGAVVALGTGLRESGGMIGREAS
jgi:hypothetical protein